MDEGSVLVTELRLTRRFSSIDYGALTYTFVAPGLMALHDAIYRLDHSIRLILGPRMMAVGFPQTNLEE